MRQPQLFVLPLISTLLTSILLVGQVRARNFALGSFLVWGFIAHGKFTIDALLWADNVDLPESRKHWCDFGASEIPQDLALSS